MENNNDGKIIRAPSLKRGKTDERLCDRIKLKKVLGLTVCSNAALDVSPTNGVLAYPAGCTVVLFNAKKLSQLFLLNTSKKAITTVAYSHCGRYIATGECGINPALKIWELDTNDNAENNACGTVVAEFLGHKYAVSCIAFSPTGKYLVSVGSQHDMIVNVFDWKLNLKIASNKVSAKVAAVSFSEDGSYFVTVGNRHVKYWYLEGSRKYKEPVPLMGRSAILGELRNNDFCAVSCGKDKCADSTYAITRLGHLVEFNSRRLLDKWVACRTTSANCMSVTSKLILVGCAEAIVRIFNTSTLEYITTLPRTHYLGVDVAQGLHINHIMAMPNNARYPDTIAMVFDEERLKVTCVYNDHSLYIWDLRDIKRVGKSHSFLYHSACIWGVESVPSNDDVNQTHTLPLDCFLTCSSDDTIRVWGFDSSENNEIYRKNIYSKELFKVLYIDNELNYIKDSDNPILSTEKVSSYDGRNGVRCMKINLEMDHLATGDRSGNIRIYNLSSLKLVTMIEAHDSEVLCLEYTKSNINVKLLASASRDRLIHVFDVLDSYKILQTLDDHSSSITSVKFVGSGSTFQMVSCGADKSIMFRTFQNNQFLRGMNCSGKTTLYDMEIDNNSKHILTACQDRNIRVYATSNAKHTKTFKGSHSDDGSLIKVSLDPSGIYVATSCTDKTLSVYDYYSNECMARMYGHSELVTGLKFTNDCKYLISASGDSCVFIWQIPHDMIVTMQARLSQQKFRSGQTQNLQPVSPPNIDIIIDTPQKYPNEISSTSPFHVFMEQNPLTPGYRLSEVGQLPQWAKRKNHDEVQDTTGNLNTNPSHNHYVGHVRPRGRWAQRGQIDSEVFETRISSESPSNNFYPTTLNYSMQTSDYNSGSSKDIYNQSYFSEDSSIDSGMENRREFLLLNKQYKENKTGSSPRIESTTEHDGDVEDISDGERTSSDYGLMFYPNPSPGTPTEFKVNAMNEDELRKSVRRQKFEKLGLNLATKQNPPSTGTGTGTGTSDTEDEGSTPSGENAERSLVSTLSESIENLSQQASSSFLQAALDGPGELADRGDRSRCSISAKHNNENKSLPFSKSYTNSKKEELLKVINEAKQKLENVGYRSNLRGSQSISDLSHMPNIDGPMRSSRAVRPGQCKASNKNNIPLNFFNCAKPKFITMQNFNSIRQPYNNSPLHLPTTKKNVQLTSAIRTNIPTPLRPTNFYLSTKSEKLNFENENQTKFKKQGGNIWKHYKSCPVSPVHEEVEWKYLPCEPKAVTYKRHSMYSQDAKLILDTIHTDTEKMIEEITKKYGDLDNYEPEQYLNFENNITVNKIAKKIKDENQQLINEEDNFSSDSLEDCSLEIDLVKNKGKKRLCYKHKKSVTTKDIYKEFYQNNNSNICLSQILDRDDEKNEKFLEAQRHSSASFFCMQNSERKSQESILSDELSGVSYYNSMESILSDESDCKSAPLEAIFYKRKNLKPFGSDIFEKHELSSKSYGSSPNASNDFDVYMQLKNQENQRETYEISNVNGRVRQQDLLEGLFEPKYDFIGKPSRNEYIPTLNLKNLQYKHGVSKSLSQEFANQRKETSFNLICCDTNKHMPKQSYINQKNIAEVDIKPVHKSYSFEIRMDKMSNFENILRKFEKDKQANKTYHTLDMNYVPHKPPVATRSSSLRSRRRSIKKNQNSKVSEESCNNIETKEKHTFNKKSEEKSFEMYISEGGDNLNDHMGSLDIPKKCDRFINYATRLKPEEFQSNCNENPKLAKLCNTSSPNFNDICSFETIAKKINIVNKLIQMEEQKLEHSRQEKENRMKPFQCNLQQKGYVRSLTMNFDKLAKSIETEIQAKQNKELFPSKMKRNYSLPDVLEAAEFSNLDLQINSNLTEYTEFTQRMKNLCNIQKKHNKGNIKNLTTTQNGDSAIRRACSLSDLSMGKGSKTVPQHPQKNTVQSRFSISARPNNTKRIQSSSKTVAGMGSRSISVGVLNQSDSETDVLVPRGGIFRPTISSQNRSNNALGNSRQYNSKTNSTSSSRRKGLPSSYSNVNLSTIGQDDSSSEEATQPNLKMTSKPTVPPRPRGISSDHKNKGISFSSKTKIYDSFDDFSHKDAENCTSENTSQLCANIINMLNTTTNAVIQLYTKLKYNDGPSGNKNNNVMLKELENAIIMTQNMLTKITNKNDNTNHVNFNSNDTNILENGEYLLMMNKCADILGKVRSRHKSNEVEDNS